MRFYPLIVSFAGAGIAALLLLPHPAMAEGMPQLDFKTPLTISQVIWGSIIFVVLYSLLSRNALPLVSSVLDERAARISDDLDSARAAKALADVGVAEANQATVRARSEAQAAINTAVHEAKKAAAIQAETLNARLERQLADSEAQIASARALAMSALRQVATETATTVVTRLTGVPPTNAEVDAAIGLALGAARGSR
jgi:F-type H+-transporting ATPase subunit b